MKRNIETGLIIVKEDVFSKIRRNLFVLFFNKEAKLLKMMSEIEKPRNFTNNSKIIIPKEIKY